MRVLGGLAIVLFLAGGLPAQHRGGGAGNAAPRAVNPTPFMTGTFGNVVFPGGTPATGVQRSFGNVAFPGGGGPRLVVPGAITDPNFALGLSNTVQGRNVLGGQQGRRRGAPVYAFPVYSYDPGMSSYYAYPPQAPVQQQPPQNVVVVYPPQPAPVIMNPYGPAGAEQNTGEQSNFRMYQAPYNQPAQESPAVAEPTHYLLAFKDHTIYSAVAYWVEGDTLHYFTSGNKHNQASLALVDREMTDRLNRESGTEVKLPR